MVMITLRVKVLDTNAIRSMQFDGSLIVYDACKDIQEKLGESAGGGDHGLFLPDEDYRRGKWLNPGRTLDYYDMKNGVLVEYKKKHRPLKVILMDESQRTVLIDDSHNVGQIIRTICARINLSNPDEFSITCDSLDREKKIEGGIYEETKKERLAKEKEEKKMSQLQQKLHTDDEINWLNHDKSLREQGVKETDTVRLRKKFFFSDQNVDKNDPVQLNLIYVQARDDLLKSLHPCTLEEAIQFAAMQCQVQLGDHNPETHVPGAIDLRAYLPEEHCKVKDVAKRIFQEHRKLKGMTDLNAKYRYIQLCRSLKTYGMTFFLVKEKVKLKNKVVPRLLGISRDSVMRVDETTKEVIKTWPLTTVRRWAASPTSFTLDFGDYSDEYYSVQTTEGEAISRLIAGYIDFIIKKKKESEFNPNDDEGSSVTTTENISGAKGTAIQFMTASVGRATESNVGRVGVIRGTRGGITATTRSGVKAITFGGATGTASGSDKAAGRGPLAITAAGETGMDAAKAEEALFTAKSTLQGNIQSGYAAVNSCNADLNSPTSLPPLGKDDASIAWKRNTQTNSSRNASAQLASLSATTASIMLLTSSDKTQQNMLATGSAVVSMTSNLAELTKASRLLAALADDEDTTEGLLVAARSLADATSKMLQAVNPDSAMERKDLIAAATAIGTHVKDLLTLMPRDEEVVEERVQEELVELAKQVSTGTAGLVALSKELANRADDPSAQSRVIEAAKRVAISTSQLVTSARVLAPTINNMQCQEALVEAAKHLLAAIGDLQDHGQQACSDKDLTDQMASECGRVRATIAQLVARSKNAGQAVDEGLTHEPMASDLAPKLASLDWQDPEAVEAMRGMVGELVRAMEADAEKESDTARDRLLALAASLAAACEGMATDASKQGELSNLVASVAQDAAKKKALRNLEMAVKKATSACTQLTGGATNSSGSNRNAASQQQLMGQAKLMGDQLAATVQTTKDFGLDRANPKAQLALLNDAKAIIAPGSKLVATAKVATATIGDPAAAKQLSNFSRSAATALAELKAAQETAMGACGGLEIIAALDQVSALRQGLEDAQGDAQAGRLEPQPGETTEACALEVAATTKTVGSSMAQLLSAAMQQSESLTGLAAKDTSAALQVMAAAARGVAATSKDPLQKEMLASAVATMAASHALIGAAEYALANPGDAERSCKLQGAAKGVQRALQDMVQTLPGQRDIEEALKTVKAAMARLDTAAPASMPADHNVDAVRSQFAEATGQLSLGAAILVAASRGSPDQVADATRRVEGSFQTTVATSELLAGCEAKDEIRKEAQLQMRALATATQGLLLATRQVTANPTAVTAKTALTAAARQLQDAVDGLVATLSKSGPGVQECESAARSVQALMAGLQNKPTEPVGEHTYFECLGTVQDKSAALVTATRNISNSARANDPAQIGQAATAAATNTADLANAAVQAAYLIGVADPASAAAVPGCIDAQAVIQSQKAIEEAIDVLRTPDAGQQQVLGAATAIAKHTSALCSACKVASAKTSNPVAKQNFVASAKAIAATTGTLVQAIKALAAAPDEDKQARCVDATAPLAEAVDQLVALAASPEFATTPAVIAPEAQAKQEPVMAAARRMVATAEKVLEMGKQLAVDQTDTALVAGYTAQAKDLSDAIKALATAIQANAPGQKECGQAVETLQDAIQVLDHSVLAASVGGLKLRSDNDLQGFQEAMLNACQDLGPLMDAAVTAGKAEPQKLGHAVLAFSEQFLPLTSAATGAATKLGDRKRQQQVLEHTKTVAHAALDIVKACQAAGGDKNNGAAHGDIDDAVTRFQLDLAEMTRQLEDATGDIGAIGAIAANVQRAVAALDNGEDGQADQAYVEYNTAMQAAAKKLATALPAVTAATPDTMVDALRTVAGHFSEIATHAKGALATSDNEEANAVLQNTTKGLGVSVAALVAAGKALQGNPDDFDTRKAVAAGTQQVSQDIAKLFGSLQMGTKGMRAAEGAVQTLEGLVGELNTTAMFASAGSLAAEREDDKFDLHKEAVASQTKDVLDASKQLVGAQAASQDQLAAAVVKALQATATLADTTKKAAAAVGPDDRGAQELLLYGVRDVVAAEQRLLGATMAAAGRQQTDPAVANLKGEAKNIAGAVASLLKTIRSVEDESARGMRATESAIDAVTAELKTLDTSEPAKRQGATPEMLAASTKAMTLSSAKLVSAMQGGSQTEVMQGANAVRKAVVDMVQTGKGAAEASTEGKDEAKRLALQAVATSAQAALRLLTAVHKHLNDPANDAAKNVLPEHSKAVADSVNEVCGAARALKGQDMEDPDDPHVAAERELQQAAAQIETTARRLAELRPRLQKSELDGDMNFEEVILSAAQGITNATTSLMTAAQAAQHELMTQGRISTVKGSDKYRDDAAWAEGLVSAAKNVAGATALLGDAANAAVEGEASEERLISSSMAVSSATQQLLLACRVKADKNSKAQARLDTAGKAVTKATDALVKSAKEAAVFQEESKDVELNKFKVGSIAQEIAMQEEILRKEKELENARKQLLRLRKQKYDK